MLTASQKRKENIAEYILYMWQIEDLIRANQLDLDKIKASVIDRYSGLTPDQRRAMEEWYESLIDMMRREGVVENGHLQMNKNIIGALADLTKRLLKNPKYSDFSNQYYATLPYIVELRARSGKKPEELPGEIETCFNALYGILMLRLQGKKISKETEDAVAQISKFIALLAAYYKKEQEDELDLE